MTTLIVVNSVFGLLCIFMVSLLSYKNKNGFP